MNFLLNLYQVAVPGAANTAGTNNTTRVKARIRVFRMMAPHGRKVRWEATTYLQRRQLHRGNLNAKASHLPDNRSSRAMEWTPHLPQSRSNPRRMGQRLQLTANIWEVHLRHCVSRRATTALSLKNLV